MSKKNREPRTRRPKTFETTIATAIARDHVDLHTKSVRARRDLLMYEREQVVERIVALTNALASSRQKLSGIDAAVRGLDVVLDCRKISPIEVYD